MHNVRCMGDGTNVPVTGSYVMGQCLIDNVHHFFVPLLTCFLSLSFGYLFIFFFIFFFLLVFFFCVFFFVCFLFCVFFYFVFIFYFFIFSFSCFFFLSLLFLIIDHH